MSVNGRETCPCGSQLTANAVEGIGHHNSDVELLGAGLGETVDTRDIVEDGQVLGDDTVVAGLDQVAGVGTSTIGVDLVDGDRDF